MPFYDGFLLPGPEAARVGITATKRRSATGRTTQSAKPLLREAFRLSRNEIDEIGVKLDWVLNAMRIF